jgi:hypothetical protein
MGPQADLVDHHRRHRDRVPARPSPLRLELFGHLADFVEVGVMRPVIASTLARSWPPTLPSGIRVPAGVRPRGVRAPPGALFVRNNPELQRSGSTCERTGATTFTSHNPEDWSQLEGLVSDGRRTAAPGRHRPLSRRDLERGTREQPGGVQDR